MNVAFGIDCSNQVYSSSSRNDAELRPPFDGRHPTPDRPPANVQPPPLGRPAPADFDFNNNDDLDHPSNASIFKGRLSPTSTTTSTMASRGGPHVAGTDGMDFLHRERVASHYQISAENKSRLKYCFVFHGLLFCAMLVKMVPDILDRLDIFVLEIEELFVPPPLLWEYIWVLSVLFTFSGVTAVRRNKMKNLRIYQAGIFATGLLPVLFGLIWFAKDVKKYVETRSSEDVQTWQGYPWAMLVYAFLIPALQLHILSLYFAHKLASAWKLRGQKKAQ